MGNKDEFNKEIDNTRMKDRASLPVVEKVTLTYDKDTKMYGIEVEYTNKSKLISSAHMKDEMALFKDATRLAYILGATYLRHDKIGMLVNLKTGKVISDAMVVFNNVLNQITNDIKGS